MLNLKMHGLQGISFKQEVALKQFIIKTLFHLRFPQEDFVE